MTWVLGWPLYDDDALKIDKQHNLVKDPNPGNAQRIQAARLWVADQIGVVPVLACLVNDEMEIVYAMYVDYGDNRYPPTELVPEETTMTNKQYRRIKRVMPLRDFGWYQYNDPTCVKYKEIFYEEIDDSDEDSDGRGDTSSDEGGADGEDNNKDASMKFARDNEDAAGSDTETVTNGVVSKMDLLPDDSGTSEAAKSLSTNFDACCTIDEPQL
ncbi:uncharacterized protein B0H18DRAFT_1118644 [Fomitopsis serialis]|uniref:uncharacterized protein n=1 Tax=Fomitopsis serialis TaxID=139415 RepID=UPI0020088C1B|nr:uncharacterized protein B0H18DRAFT_1118644 [Neoantrodia serialis]KAH9926882.1 hypothetical protein B0H18DRAFT_1118644 [Neoantrodia serialis]